MLEDRRPDAKDPSTPLRFAQDDTLILSLSKDLFFRSSVVPSLPRELFQGS